MTASSESATETVASDDTLEKEIPMVSIAMLAYNHGKYIRESIESILQQKTSFSFELVIGEDCSPDNTREIVLEYGRKFPNIVRVIVSEKNVGALENLRRCERACRGLYVCYCEGDDYWHSPHKLDQQVQFLENHPDYAMVHSDFRMYIEETGKLFPKAIGSRENLNDGAAFDEILSGQRLVWTLTVCVRHSVLKTVLNECPECYSTRFPMGDTQRFLEIARRGRVKYLLETLATRRTLLESATQSKSPERVLRFALSAQEILEHYIDKYGCAPEAKKAAIMRSADHVINCAFAAGNLSAATRALENYRQVGGPIPLTSYFYFYGIKRPLIKKIIRPAVASINLWHKVWSRLSRLMKRV